MINAWSFTSNPPYVFKTRCFIIQKSLKWSEKLSNVKCSEVKWSEVKWTKQNEVEWGEGKCSIAKGVGGRVFMEKVYRSSKWWEVKDWGESARDLINKKQ